MEYYNKATRLLERNNIPKAIQFFRKQLEVFEFKECYLNLGNCYRLQNNIEEALHCYIEANSAAVPFLDGSGGVYDMALNNLGLLEYGAGNDIAATQFFKAALQKSPLNYDAIFNLSTAMLRQFCSKKLAAADLAWQLYAYRFKKTKPTNIEHTIPTWDLQSKHHSIVVLAEQGYGDKLQFARYLPELKTLFKEVYVQTSVDMLDIFSDYVCVQSLEHCAAEVAIPICSLAQRFGISENSTWLRGKFDTHKFDGTKLNIGVEWQGSQTHANDHNRSCLPEYFAKLQKYANLYNCRPDAKPVPGVVMLNPQSWMQTCSYVQGLDLVISVDTSIVHVAGSVGTPCWVLQPKQNTDYRWGDDSMGTDNIWYSCVEVIRNPNSWAQVFKQVESKLHQLHTEHKLKQLRAAMKNLC